MKEDETGELDPFEVFLEQRDSGEGSVLDMLRESGDDGDLQDRLSLMGALDQLSHLLSAEQEDELPMLSKLGRFDDLRIIGEGGLARVFAGYDPRLDREVALKVLSPKGFDVAGARDWMLSEGRSLAQLKHPSVVEVFEVDEADGYPYIAMERVDGPTLQAVLDHMRLPPDAVLDPPARIEVVRAAERLAPMAERLRLALNLSEALAECHKRGVIHRDVKPGNVLLTANGQPKLIDFGLAHLEGGGASIGLTQRLVGTPGYVAPEQVDEERTGSSARSDQFSLGVILYELVTLEHPFRRGTKADTMAAVSKAAPRALKKVEASTPQDVERIVLHALEREPEDRYPNMEELASDLRAFLNYRAISLRAPSLLRRARLWVTRNQRAVVISASTLGLTMLLLVLGWLQSARAQREAWTEQYERAIDSVPGLQSPKQFDLALKQNFELREAAQQLDSGPAGRLAGALIPKVEQLELTTAKQLNEVLEPKLNDIESKRYWLQRLYASMQHDRLWGPVLRVEHGLVPWVETNDAMRELGMVSLPDGALLFRYDPYSEVLTQLDPVTPDQYLQPGRYRMFAPLSDGEWGETEFDFSGFGRRLEIRPNPKTSRFDGLWKTVQGRQLDPSRLGHGIQIFRVPSFEIYPAPITWNEYGLVTGQDLSSPTGPIGSLRRYAKKDGTGYISPDSLELDSPAVLTIDQALYFADLCGCRLATPIEYGLAIEAGLIEVVAGAKLATGHPTTDAEPSKREVEVGELLQLIADRRPWTEASWAAGKVPQGATMFSGSFRLVRSLSQDVTSR